MTTITIPARIASAGFEYSPEFDDGAEPAASDQPGDDDHREREQDRLVERRGAASAATSGAAPSGASAGRVAPIEAAASTVFTGTRRMPSAVIRMQGGIA